MYQVTTDSDSRRFLLQRQLYKFERVLHYTMNSNRIVHVSTEASTMASNGIRPIEAARTVPRPCGISASGQSDAKDLWSPCSDCSSDENNSPTALNSFRWDKPAMEDKSLVDFNSWTIDESLPSSSSLQAHQGTKRPLSSGYVNLKTDDEDEESKQTCINNEPQRHICRKVEDSIQRRGNLRKEITIEEFSLNSACSPSDTSEKNFDEEEQSHGPRIIGLQSSNSFLMSPPTPVESENSLFIKHQKDLNDLKKVAWFQAGIPREIALEVLSGKPVGSFIVRESTTKPGCYALSLRVPPGKNPSGIAHYLILHTNRGYKIKGFTKEFSSLEALITHHSVMPELLPCPLSLPRYHNDRDHSRREDDMADLPEKEEEKRCSLFSDIHWLMTDLQL